MNTQCDDKSDKTKCWHTWITQRGVQEWRHMLMIQFIKNKEMPQSKDTNWWNNFMAQSEDTEQWHKVMTQGDDKR